MNLFGEVRVLRSWTSSDGELSRRIALGRVDGEPSLIAYFGAVEAWRIIEEQRVEFFAKHPNTIWLVDEAGGMERAFANLAENVRRRLIIDLGLLYRLVHLAEFSDAADDWRLGYLAEVYLQEELTTERGDPLPILEIEGLDSEAAGLERAIATWLIFPWLWREAVQYSGEQRLLGYDSFMYEKLS